MILSTITLNPAIDKTYFVNRFSVDNVNRVERIKVNMGGKGVNVAATAAKCGIPCIAGGFLSGYNGQMIGKYLKDAGVATDFVYTEGDTRTNIKIIDTENKTYTDVNESGPAVSDSDIRALLEKAADMAVKSDVVYLGGSFPPGVKAELYKELISVIREKGARAVLDADGEAFRQGVEAAPSVIKPNQAELESLIGRKLKTVSDVVNAAKQLYDGGVETVLVSLGGNGAVCVSGGKAYRVYPLNVPVVSTVGAGDSFLCGYLYGQTVTGDIEQQLKYAMSFAGAKIQTEGTDIPSFDELCRFADMVTVERIEE